MENERYKMTFKLGKKSKKLRIIGKDFTKNNMNKGKLIINNKKFRLREYFKIENINQNEINIYLLLSNNIYNKAGMFKDCECLTEFKICNEFDLLEESDDSNCYIDDIDDIDNIDNFINFNASFTSGKDETKTTNFESDFSEIHNSSIVSILNSDIMDNNINIHTICNNMFYKCSSLSSLPDISKWKINNITSMSKIFYNCKSLSSLPDISQWNTNNVEDMSDMFYNCEKLLTLPDISKFNTMVCFIIVKNY